MQPVKALFFEPFYGGSHRDFLDALCANTAHCIDILTLPGENWKRRYRYAALNGLAPLRNKPVDLILTTNMTNVAHLKALLAPPVPPILLYMHESQLTYPENTRDRRDYLFALTEITSALAAEVVVFNSRFHRESFLSAVKEFESGTADTLPPWVWPALEEKSCVEYPGCYLSSVPEPTDDRAAPVILWNHRWEYDKKPGIFLRVLRKIAGDFRLILLGEDSHGKSDVLKTIEKEFGGRILHSGFVKNRTVYFDLLGRADIAVSTSIQENFGISMVEAITAGCVPLAPRRLSYPEVIPSSLQQNCLYADEKALTAELDVLVGQQRYLEAQRAKVAAEKKALIQRYDWSKRIIAYDRLISATTAQNKTVNNGRFP